MNKYTIKSILIFLCFIFTWNFSQALAIAETPQEIFKKGTEYYEKGDFRNAVTAFRSAIVMDPANKKLWRAYDDAYQADAATRFMATLTGSFNAITYEELLERQKQNTEIVLIDLRSAKDFAEEHIPKAINIPLEELRTKLIEFPKLKFTEIVVYCAAGPRSATGQMYLSMLGYTNVKYLKGGVMAWQSATEKKEEPPKKAVTKKKPSIKIKK